MTVGVEGLRQRKKQRTRATIAGVALDLFAAQGFQATTLRQIADAAGVAPRTVSGYFPSKEDLLFPDREAFFAELERRLTHREEGETTADALRSFIRWLLDDLEHDPGDARRRRSVVDGDPVLRTYERGLQERAERAIAAAAAVDLGLHADDLLPHMVAAATMAALDAIGRNTEGGPALADQALVFVGGGVAALAEQVRD
jgi:AcrR family transcriptional regulator